MVNRYESIGRARTFLFVPGARPDRFDRAIGTPADFVVIDLEATVRPDAKSTARQALAEWLAARASAKRVLVRLNPVDSPWFSADVDAVAGTGIAGVVLPLAQTADSVEAAIKRLPLGLPTIVLIETAAGMLDSVGIARVPGVSRLAFGNMDYETDTWTRGRDSKNFPSAMLVLASRAANLPPPVAGVTAAFRESGRLAADSAWERDQGFGAKFCIHPDQLETVARAFAPTEAERVWARHVLEAAENTHAFELNGELVDRPVIERAKRIESAFESDQSMPKGPERARRTPVE